MLDLMRALLIVGTVFAVLLTFWGMTVWVLGVASHALNDWRAAQPSPRDEGKPVRERGQSDF